MTRERAKELAPIIKAYGEGKEVEFKNELMKDWKLVSQDIFGHREFNAVDGIQYRIKPETVTRPMTRGEVLYMVTTTPWMVVRESSRHAYYPAQFFEYNDDRMTGYVKDMEYAIIDKHGNPIDGWHKFETTDDPQ